MWKRSLAALIVGAALFLQPAAAFGGSVSDPSAVMAAIESAVSSTSVEATTYGAQLASLGITAQQATVVRYGVGQAYAMAAAASSGSGSVPETATAWIASHSAQLLQVAAVGTTKANGWSNVQEVIDGATSYLGDVWFDLSKLLGLTVGTPDVAPTAYIYPQVTSLSVGDRWPASAAVYDPAWASYTASTQLAISRIGAGLAKGANGCALKVSCSFSVDGGGHLYGYVTDARTLPYNTKMLYLQWYNGHYILRLADVPDGWFSSYNADWTAVVGTGSNGSIGTSATITSDAIKYGGYAVIDDNLWDPNNPYWVGHAVDAMDPNTGAISPYLGQIQTGDPGQYLDKGSNLWDPNNAYWLYHETTSGLYPAGPAGDLQKAADDWDRLIDTLPDWGAFNWFKDVLRFVGKPVQAMLRAAASVVGWISTVFESIPAQLSQWFVPSEQANTLMQQRMQKGAMDGLFASSGVFGTMRVWGDQLNVKSLIAGQATAVDDPVLTFYGVPVTFRISTYSGSLVSMRPFFAACLWVGFGFWLLGGIRDYLTFSGGSSGSSKD